MNILIKRKAFTLVELLMVIGIISIMMTLLIPSIGPIKTETKELSIKKNEDTLKEVVDLKLARLRAQEVSNDTLLDSLMTDLNQEPTINSMTNPFDGTKRGIGLIVGDTYDNTDKAVYLFTIPPKEETLPKGTAYIVLNN